MKNYKLKLKFVNYFRAKLLKIFVLYFFDCVGEVDVTPRMIYRVIKRHFKSNKLKFKRKNLKELAKICFYMFNNEDQELTRKQVEEIYKKAEMYSGAFDALSLLTRSKTVISYFKNVKFYIELKVFKFIRIVSDIFVLKINVIKGVFLF